LQSKDFSSVKRCGVRLQSKFRRAKSVAGQTKNSPCNILDKMLHGLSASRYYQGVAAVGIILPHMERLVNIFFEFSQNILRAAAKLAARLRKI
jgi:hypothetical protein